MANINQNFEQLGKDFIELYYKTFDTNRQNLAQLYGDQSMMTFEAQQFIGAQNIAAKLAELPFKKVQHQVVNCDCQPNPQNGGVIVFVTGKLLIDENQNPLMFAQIFHLAPTQSGGFFCMNDMFRLNIA